MLQNHPGTERTDKTPQRPDLHCHSHYSDGDHSPEFLLQRAVQQQVDVLAITDHDSVHCYRDKQLQGSAVQLDIALVCGLELSCDWEGLEIHVLGLCVDPENPQLQAVLEQQQHSRRQRMAAIAGKLQQAGVSGLSDYIEQLQAVAVTRSHAARFLVESGRCKNTQKAFKNWLGRRGRAYVPAHWVSLGEAIAAIRAAAGIAVLAHPSRYPLSRGRLHRLVDEFQREGGEALESSYTNIDPLQQRALTQQCEERGLYISCGSDFHSSTHQWNNLGKASALGKAGEKNAIWLHPGWHYWSG